MPNCEKCDDTGRVWVGSNEFPCDCPSGDLATFDVNGAGEHNPVTGAELKAHLPHRDSLTLGDLIVLNLRIREGRKGGPFDDRAISGVSGVAVVFPPVRS